MAMAIGKVNMPELTGAGLFSARNLAVPSMPGSRLHSGFSTRLKEGN